MSILQHPLGKCHPARRRRASWYSIGFQLFFCCRYWIEMCGRYVEGYGSAIYFICINWTRHRQSPTRTQGYVVSPHAANTSGVSPYGFVPPVHVGAVEAPTGATMNPTTARAKAERPSTYKLPIAIADYGSSSHPSSEGTPFIALLSTSDARA